MLVVGDRNHFSKKRDFINDHEPLWTRIGLREARNSNSEHCGDSLKYIYLLSFPLPCV